MFLQKNEKLLLNIVKNLEIYKPFLPQTLFLKEGMMDSGTKFDRTTSSRKAAHMKKGSVVPQHDGGSSQGPVRRNSKDSMGSSGQQSTRSKKNGVSAITDMFSLGLEINSLTIVHCQITNILAELKKNFTAKTEIEEQNSQIMELFHNTCTLYQGFIFHVDVCSVLFLNQ